MAGLVTSSFAVVCLFGPALLRNFTKPPTNYDFAFFECVALQIGSTNVTGRTAEELEAATASKQITMGDDVTMLQTHFTEQLQAFLSFFK